MSITIKHKRSAVASSKPTGAQIDSGEIAVNYSDTDPALYIKDSTGAVIRIAGNGAAGCSSSSAVAPTTPADGDTWVDISAHPPSMKVWDATTSKWEVIGSSGSGTAPTSPATGAVWVDTSTVPNVIKVWDGSNWVLQAGATITASVAPAAPATGQIWVDTSASPSPIKIWDGSSWVTTAATGGASQALANDAKYATKAEVQAEDLWDRTGTEIHPKTAGDDVFTSGDVKVGGTTGTPNISLTASGSGAFQSATDFSTNSAGGMVELKSTHASTPVTGNNNLIRLVSQTTSGYSGVLIGLGKYQVSANPRSELTFKIANTGLSSHLAEFKFRGDGKALLPGGVSIGGTLPASPEIELKGDGSTVFKGKTHEFGSKSSAGPQYLTVTSGGTGSTGRFGYGIKARPVVFATTSNTDHTYLGVGTGGHWSFRQKTDDWTTLGAEVVRINEDGNIRAIALAAAGRVHASNAAAKAGGLSDGDFYRKADGTLMVVYT